MKIGVVASKEFFAISSVLGKREDTLITVNKHQNISYWKADKEHRHYGLYMIRSDIGELAAAAATQALIDCTKVDFVVNFGMAHALHSDVKQSSVCVVPGVVHYDFDVSSCRIAKRCEYPQYYNDRIPVDPGLLSEVSRFDPSLPQTICASGDTFVINNADKAILQNICQADICDMNAAGVLLTCITNDKPCLILKGITDGVHNGATSDDTIFDLDAQNCFKQVLDILEFLS